MFANEEPAIDDAGHSCTAFGVVKDIARPTSQTPAWVAGVQQ
jgi:hypothetical protein